MAGILGHDAWRRSNGGLWLPQALGMPETVYGWCPCVTPCTPCPVCATPCVKSFTIEVPAFPLSGACDQAVGTWVTNRGPSYLNLDVDRCTWDLPGYPPQPANIIVTIEEDGNLWVSIAFVNVPYTAASYGILPYFSGSAPFDCAGISSLELPFLSGTNVSGCGLVNPGDHSVYITANT